MPFFFGKKGKHFLHLAGILERVECFVVHYTALEKPLHKKVRAKSNGLWRNEFQWYIFFDGKRCKVQAAH